MIQLFDYVKLVFVGSEKRWNELKATDKSRNFFMMNRFLSIKYPVQVSLLSHIKINPASTADYWHTTMGKLFKTVPNWIYAKTKKKSAEDKKKNLPSEAMVSWYCQKEEISRRDYDDAVKMFGEEFLKEVLQLEKILKSQGLLKES